MLRSVRQIYSSATGAQMKRAALIVGLAFAAFGCEGTVELQTVGEDGTPIHTGSTTVPTNPPGEDPSDPVEPEVCAEGNRHSGWRG